MGDRDDEILATLRTMSRDLSDHRAEAAHHWGSADARLARLERSVDSIAPRVAALETRARRWSPPAGIPAVAPVRPAQPSEPELAAVVATVTAASAVGTERWRTVGVIAVAAIGPLALALAGVLASQCSSEPVHARAEPEAVPSSSASDGQGGGLAVP